jgi:predicted esterase
MPDERWQRVKEIFSAASERPPEAREAFLREACGTDGALRRDVDSLLAAGQAAGGFLSVPALVDDETAPPSGSAPTVDGASIRACLAVGTRLGPYEVVSFLGAGGMGEVYRARDTRLDRTVALKVLPAAAAPARYGRFEREARAISRLSHPHICALHDVGQDGGVSFLVMEYLEGETLAERLRRGPLPVEEALRHAGQIAAALEEAHRKGIVHRDVKPANVVLTRNGAKLLDFGIAKLRADAVSPDASTAAELTVEGAVMGTAQYMAPEQLEGREVDARTDVFAFGVVLYEMLTGRKAFEAESRAGLVAAILHSEPAPVSRFEPHIPAWLDAVVQGCLAKSPRDRWSSGGELLAALGRAGDAQPGWAALGDGWLSRWARVGPGPRRLVASRTARIAVTAAVAALSIAAALVWTSARSARVEAEHNAAVAEVEHLVDAGKFVDVWRAARSALQRWPGDARIDQMLRATTDTVTIATDPPGAAVALKAYDDIDGEWLPLGASPLTGVRAPLGMLRWRITKDGFEPLEARLEVGAPAAAVGRPDVDARPIRLRPLGSEVPPMVFVPGGRQGSVELTDFWIDRTEVTNRDFKAFVDRGGYDEPTYWMELEGGHVGAGARFGDRTGRPGPATWELQTYAEGQEDHPVTGVSWFEAEAFCRAAGKSLPTVSHWRRAFGATFFMEVVTLGNFSGRGPEPVQRLRDVGPWGTYGMAGNVKEWVWNDSEGRRYILGGSWNEPVYMATHDDVRPPLDRAETHGFRCIRESAPSEPAAYAASARQAKRDFSGQKVADDTTFEIFRGLYSYDDFPLGAKTEGTEEGAEWRRERVSFAAAYGGERVLANILIPRITAPPYQVVIWFPGSYALDLKRSDGDLPFSYYFDFLPRSGRALVYPVYKGTYERSMPRGGQRQFRDLVIQWSKDLGRTIDYLSNRSDLDGTKLAYYGYSMGADDAIPVVALEPRLKTAILLTGGLSAEARLPEVEPVNFLPRMKLPVLLLGGQYDFHFPVETSQRPLFDLLGAPAEHKRHVVFEGAGHVPPRLGVIREILGWLDRHLGPVGQGRAE